jgi:2,5-furandicarboxylate decarboxylase 1
MPSSSSTDFRGFIERLRARGDLVDIHEELDLSYDVGALCRVLSDRDGPAALIHNCGKSSSPAQQLAVNLYGPRRRIAAAFGLEESELLDFVAKKIRARLPPERMSFAAAPCQEVVMEGGQVDLTQWPIPLWNLGDGGPYITAGLSIARHPEFGLNIAHHRGLIYGPREIGLCVAPDHHMRLVTDEGRAGGRRVEAAIVNGVRPSITIAAASDFAHGDYELEVAGALEDRAIQTVRCKSVDLEVPADSEMVIEGYFDGEVRDEGPFVEFTGYQTPVITSPVMKVTAVTHRRNPIFHGVFAGKPPCETNTLWRELEEAEAFSVLRRRFPMLKSVHRPPQLGRDFIGIVQVDAARCRPGMVNTLLAATSAVMPRLKFVIAVDDDINLYDLTDVMWAVATRCNPAVGAQLLRGTMTSFLDPSSGGLTGKLLLNATRNADFTGKLPGYPPASLQKVTRILDSSRSDSGLKS